MIIPPALRAIPSAHRPALETRFGGIRPDPGWEPPRQPMLFLCFTNRCGSNYLAQLLASTGAFNEAGEFFNAETVLHHAARLGLRSLPAYVSALPHLVPARRFLAAKAGADQLVMLADAGVLLPGATYVLLERQDRLGQAISRVIATQNGRWTTAHAALREDAALVYDAAAITDELDKIARGNAALYSFLAANGIRPVHVTYEQVVENPQAVIDQIGAALCAPGLRVDTGAVAIGRQATGVNAEWARRYKKESTSF
jgi:LPS sulfotransferase NodH